MEDLNLTVNETEAEIVPSFDFIHDKESESHSLIAEHRSYNNVVNLFRSMTWR